MDRNVLGCFLLGVGVGVGIGVVVAPQTGEQVRRRVKGQADGGMGYLKQRGAALRDSAADLFGKGKKAVERRQDEESRQRMEGEGGRARIALIFVILRSTILAANTIRTFPISPRGTPPPPTRRAATPESKRKPWSGHRAQGYVRCGHRA